MPKTKMPKISQQSGAELKGLGIHLVELQAEGLIALAAYSHDLGPEPFGAFRALTEGVA